MDRIVVITGASSGIGRAAAIGFAQKGDTVVLASRREEVLQELARECERYGGAMVVATDVSHRVQLENLIDTVLDEFGRIDVLVNNAAVYTLGNFEKIPFDAVRQTIMTNLMGPLFLSHAALQIFKLQGHGTLINVSSMVGVAGQPHAAPYVVSKFGLHGLGVALAQELEEYEDIHACTVFPSVVDTNLFHHAANYSKKKIRPPSPVIDPERVAEAIVSLADDPKPELYVDSRGKIFGAVKALSPVLSNKMVKEMIDKQQFSDEPTQQTDGALYVPMMQGDTVTGGWRQAADDAAT